MSRCARTLAAGPAEAPVTHSFADDGISRAGRSRGIGGAPNRAKSGTVLSLNPAGVGEGGALNLKPRA